MKTLVITLALFCLTPTAFALEESTYLTLIEKAGELIEGKKYTKAHSLLEQLCKRDDLTMEQRSRAYYYTAYGHMEEGKTDSAIKFYSKAINSKSSERWNFSSLVNRAMCYNKGERFDEALSDIELALLIWPEHKTALSQKADILRKMDAKIRKEPQR